MKKLFTYFLFFPFLISAQQWQYLGLSSVSVSSIAVDWANPDVIYAGSVGYSSSDTLFGGIFKSTNGGVSWDTLIRGVTVNQLVVHPKNSNIIYATVRSINNTTAGLIKTTDAGNSWQRSDSGLIISDETGASQIAIDPAHPDTMYCGTAGFFGGKFYRSMNGGTSWVSQGDSSGLIGGVVCIAVAPDSTNNIFAGTENGDLIKSTDYGVTWNLTNFKKTEEIPFSIEFGKEDSILYVGSTSTNEYPVALFKTTDLGNTWSNPVTGLSCPGTIRTIQIDEYNNNKYIFMTMNTGYIYECIEGQPWKKIGNGGTITLFDTKLYAGTSGGVYVWDILTSTTKQSNPLPVNYCLYQNYPNPFNPGTSIEYELPNCCDVLLEIFNIQGEKVKTLVNKNQSSGKYSIYWNGKDEKGIQVSSGVYFYILHAGGYTVSKKMIYLK
ncbi:MAG: FlgD immunoglobulin-like domain containing protein [Ignavibacteriaceae bacterium]